jgi:uncharacterized protein (DUF362 family)
MSARVAAVRTAGAQYPKLTPYHPAESYPEYPFAGNVSQELNPVYAGVRELFVLYGLDAERFGTPAWNPLESLIEPGMTVVLKPNFVLSRHKEDKDVFSIITHPSVLRAVADYVWIALRGQGQIIIADAPQYDCNWPQLVRTTGLEPILAFYGNRQGPRVRLLDLRNYWSRWKPFPSLLEPLPGDPQGSMVVNLGKRSALYGKPHPEKSYGAVYHRSETIAHHTGETHEYEFSRTVMSADVVISIPKLKVDMKVGASLNAKGLAGIVPNKNYLVHYLITPPQEGGDQYPDGLFSPMEEMIIKTERWMYDHLLAPRRRALEYLHRSIYRLHNSTTRRLGLKVSESKRQLDDGNWYGNDSAWRMTVDLFRAFCFADPEGILHRTPQRRFFSIIDGVIGGECCGPLTPDPVPSGVLLAGDDLLATDIVAARLMGFDPLKIRTYQYLLSEAEFDLSVRCLDDIEVFASDPAWAHCLSDTTSAFLNFKPHPGWVGHLEINSSEKSLFTSAANG